MNEKYKIIVENTWTEKTELEKIRIRLEENSRMNPK